MMKNWMFLGVFMISVLTGFGQRLEVVSSSTLSSEVVLNSSVLGTNEGLVYVGDIQNGDLDLGVYSQEAKRYLVSEKISLFNEDGRRIEISGVLMTDGGLVVLGKLKSAKGYSFYWSNVGEGDESKVKGQLFYEVTLKPLESIHQVSFTVATTMDRIGLSFIKSVKESNKLEGHLLVVAPNGKVLQDSKFSFRSNNILEGKSVLFETYLDRFEGGVIVVNEQVNFNDPNSWVTSVVRLKDNDLEGKKTIISKKGLFFSECDFGNMVDGNFTIVGYPFRKENLDEPIEGLNIVKYNVDKEKVTHIQKIIFAGFEKTQMEHVEDFSPEELKINFKHKIVGVRTLPRGNTLVIISGEGLNKSKAGIMYSSDFVALSIHEDNGLNWNTWIPVYQRVDVYSKELNDLFSPDFHPRKNVLVFRGEENGNMLLRRPMLNKIGSGFHQVPYQSFWMTLDLKDGQFEEPTQGGVNKDGKSDAFLNQYIQFSKEETKLDR